MTTIDRQLKTIRKISRLSPIDGADRIELAHIDGWQAVVKKGDYQEGNEVSFFEIDSFILKDKNTDFLSFLGSTRLHPITQQEGWRVKTMKLRGVISQGLVLPLDQGASLEVILWEHPLPVSRVGKAAGNFPSHVPRTDQPRIQNVIGKLPLGQVYHATVKLDGTSFTAYKKGDHIGVCSRNFEIKLDDPENEENIYVKMFKKYGFRDFFERFPFDIAFQGEIIGPGIQKNFQKVNEHRLYIFDIWLGQRYATPSEQYDLMRLFNCDTFYEFLCLVPGVDIFRHDKDMTVEDYLAKAEGTCEITDAPREGIVCKAIDGSHSFKVVAQSYLLSEE